MMGIGELADKHSAVLQLVGVCVAFSSHVKIMGEGSTNHFLPAFVFPV